MIAALQLVYLNKSGLGIHAMSPALTWVLLIGRDTEP